MPSWVEQKIWFSSSSQHSPGHNPNTKPPNKPISAVLEALKECSRSKNLRAGKKLHADVVESGHDLNIYVANSLISMYSKCGDMAGARDVFNSMQDRSVVAWANLVLGYAESGDGQLALQMFSRMQQEGFSPNRIAYLAALKACASLSAKREDDQAELRNVCLEKGRNLHSQVSNCGYETDIFVASALVTMYGKCGSMTDASSVFFGKMQHRDVAAWNALVLGYAESGQGRQALKLFQLMQDEGITPNARSYLAALKACVNIVAKSGQEFESPALKAEFLETGKCLHQQLAKYGYESDTFVASVLVDLYSRCGSVGDAESVFNRMTSRSLWSWNAMILGFAESGNGDAALQLFARCYSEGFTPQARTYVAAIKACVSSSDDEQVPSSASKLLGLERGFAVHAQAASYGHNSNIFVENALVEMYAKCGSLFDALRIFNGMQHRTATSWASIILGYAENGECELALRFFAQMHEQGFTADFQCQVAALRACAIMATEDEGNEDVKKLCLERALAIHLQIREAGAEPNVFVANTLMDTYAKTGSIELARRVFDRMQHRTVVSWTSIVLGYVGSGDAISALELYALMRKENIQPNRITYVAALRACGCLAALELGRQIHAEALTRGLKHDLLVATSVVDFYGRCGDMIEAQRVFDSIGSRNDLVAWNTLIAGYSRQGDTGSVFRLFKRMLKERNVQPDGITFLSVLSVCGHAGLVEEGREYFARMCYEHGISPAMEHYVCMVDLLARANHLEEALRMAEEMRFPADRRIWRSILGACKKWNNAEVGRLAFESILKLDDTDTAAYVLMRDLK